MTPPLLFVHGFLGDGEDWAALRRALEPVPSATFELPGHGASLPLAGPRAGSEEGRAPPGTPAAVLAAQAPAVDVQAGGTRAGPPRTDPERSPTGYDPAALAAPAATGTGTAPPGAAYDAHTGWFGALARGLSAACARATHPPILVGYSMGGRVALYTALHHPGTASGLVLLGADPGIEQAAARDRRWARDLALARELAAAEGDAFTIWLQRWYAAPLFESLRAHPDFPQLLRRRGRQRPAYLAAALRGLSVARQPSLWPALPQLTVPALFVAGAEDPKYRGIAARIGQIGEPWRTAVCPGAGHAVHLERPAMVAGLIRELAESSGWSD